MTNHRKWTSTLALALLVCAAWANDASAQDTAVDDARQPTAQQVEALASDAAQAFRSGDFPRAIELFERAYQLEPVPNLLFNIGRCYEEMGDSRNAIQYYEEFAVAPDLDSEARRDALARASRLRAAAGMQPRQGDASTQQGSAQTASVDNTGIWVTVAGGGLVAGGAIFGLLASSTADDIQNGPTYDARVDARSQAKTQALVADGLFITGAITTGLGLYLLLRSGGSESKQPVAAGADSRLFPFATRQGAGVGLRVDF